MGKRVARPRPAEGIYVPEAIAFLRGGAVLTTLVQEVHQALLRLGQVLDQVPTSWWRAAGVTPGVIREVLRARARRLEVVLNVKEWGEFDYDAGVLL